MPATLGKEASMRSHPPPYTECKCDHGPAGRWGHEYRERLDPKRDPKLDIKEVILVCLRCDGLWNHKATAKIIERIMSRRQPAGSVQKEATLITDSTDLTDRAAVL
jgi:hypothetical protein